MEEVSSSRLGFLLISRECDYYIWYKFAMQIPMPRWLISAVIHRSPLHWSDILYFLKGPDWGGGEVAGMGETFCI